MLQYASPPMDEEDVPALYRVWLNERLAPLLLPYASTTVENILELLSNQQALLSEHTDPHLLALYQMEVERLRFVLTSYLRCRLAKIEAYWLYWVENPDPLSSPERLFLQKYSTSRAKVLEESALKHLPGKLPIKEMKVIPSKGSHVICRVLEDIGIVQVERGTTAKLLKNDIYVIQYSYAEELLLNNTIALI